MRQKILVVDDDRKTVDLIALYLQRDRYEVLTAYDGRAALDVARQRRPHLVVLDWMLPKVDGMEVCRTLRQEFDVPIIMLTARTTEEDKLIGLNLGADDYMVKPFSPRELVARVRVVLRRSSQDDDSVQELRFGDLTVDLGRHEVQVRGRRVHLTPKEFKLLGVLAQRPGFVFTRSTLLDQVFGFNYEGYERTVDVHLGNLRKKIELDPERPAYIQTVYGVGYKFVAHHAVP